MDACSAIPFVALCISFLCAIVSICSIVLVGSAAAAIQLLIVHHTFTLLLSLAVLCSVEAVVRLVMDTLVKCYSMKMELEMKKLAAAQKKEVTVLALISPEATLASPVAFEESVDHATCEE